MASRNQYFMKLATAVVILALIDHATCDGSRDIGEACSFRSQLANFIRTNDSPEGCISAKGLICMSHKCICANPAAIYETPTPPSSSDNGGSTTTAITNSASNFFKKLIRGETTTTSTTTTPAPSTNSNSGSSGITGGRCAGRAGSPCAGADSLCVQNAACLGSPVSICRCQGIYSSNTQGQCSKSATVATQALKGITSIISGK